jgi:hypothetical protein
MRGLSQQFMDDLKGNGKLSPILEAVHKDKDFIFEIRDDYLNIYYRGGNITKLERQGNEYIAKFNPAYAIADKDRANIDQRIKDNKIKSIGDAMTWAGNMHFFKGIMAHHFSNSPSETLEKDIQQMIVRENNILRSAESTDYFIVDFEYPYKTDAVDTRFDLIGLFWDSKYRKSPKNCKLAIIEVKYGDDALSNAKNGLIAHIKKTEAFLSDLKKVNSFKKEMINIFKQMRELKLINLENPHEVKLDAVIDPIEFIFILAGHNPRSTVVEVLGTIVEI